MPESRNAGLPNRKPNAEADDARDRQRQRVVHADVFHQDRRRIGADRVERALAERELPAAAGQDVEREHRDPVDQDHRHLEDDEVLHEQRRDDQRGQDHQRGAEAQRHGPLRNGLDGRGFCDDVFCSCAHDQTRFTMGSAEQAGRFDDQDGDDQRKRDRQFQFVADAGDVGAGEVLEDADQEAADDGAERRGQAAEHGGGKAVDQHAAHHVRLEEHHRRDQDAGDRRRSRTPCPSRARSSRRC